MKWIDRAVRTPSVAQHAVSSPPATPSALAASEASPRSPAIKGLLADAPRRVERRWRRIIRSFIASPVRLRPRVRTSCATPTPTYGARSPHSALRGGHRPNRGACGSAVRRRSGPQLRLTIDDDLRLGRREQPARAPPPPARRRRPLA